MAPPTLMSLPLEVRLTIWKYALPAEMEADGCTCKVVRARCDNPRPNFLLPLDRQALLLINKEAAAEVMLLPRPPTTVKFCEWPCMREWLSRVSFEARVRLERVRITEINIWGLWHSYQITDWSDTAAIAEIMDRYPMGPHFVSELEKYYAVVATAGWRIVQSDKAIMGHWMEYLFEVRTGQDQMLSRRLRSRKANAAK